MAGYPRMESDVNDAMDVLSRDPNLSKTPFRYPLLVAERELLTDDLGRYRFAKKLANMLRSRGYMLGGEMARRLHPRKLRAPKTDTDQNAPVLTIRKSGDYALYGISLPKVRFRD